VQVAEYTDVCERGGLLKPDVIQGQYNLLFRAPEKDLLPYLQARNIPFIAYSPLAGGFLTGLVTEGIKLEGTRFEEGNTTGNWYRRIYDRASTHEAVIELRRICDSRGLRLTEVSLRWLCYHSMLTEKDGIILGASNLQQLEQNMEDIARGPLPQDVVTLIDRFLG
jgi:aflatoxin B1 aldehyde reductase